MPMHRAKKIKRAYEAVTDKCEDAIEWVVAGLAFVWLVVLVALFLAWLSIFDRDK
jgi:hypothetical protein